MVLLHTGLLGLATAVAGVILLWPNTPPPLRPDAPAATAPTPVVIDTSGDIQEAGRLATTDVGRALVDPRTAALTVDSESIWTFSVWSSSEAEIELERGTVSAVVVPRVGDQRFSIATSELVASVVGTSFSVTCTPGEGTRVVVTEGVVYVELRRGGAVTLAAGDAWFEASPRAPRPPERESEPLALAPPPGSSPSSETPPEAPGSGALATSIRAARRLLAQGEHQAAVHRLVHLTPTSDAERATVAALLGDAWVVAGQPARVRAAYLEASRRGRGSVALGALVELATVQAELGEDDAAAASWRRVLAAASDGPHAPRALAALGDDEGLLARFPASREATAAMVRMGRLQLDAGRWDATADLFAAHVDSGDPARAEAARRGSERHVELTWRSPRRG